MIRILTATLFVACAMPVGAQTITQPIPQTITGIWQTHDPRYVMTISGNAEHGWRGEWYNLGDKDGMLNGNPLAIALDGDKITIDPVRTAGTFTGTVAGDGRSISGNWSQNKEALVLERASAQVAHKIDTSPHKTHYVYVQPDVKVEVLDWGGSGPPLIFLPGLGFTAHNFDELARKFTGRHHVYAITRRGFGLSDSPPPTDANYDAERLGDDVLAVMEILKIEKPVLAGHSIGGQELSSIGTRYPEKVAGLIYLDAAFGYAFFDPKVPLVPQFTMEALVRRDLTLLQASDPEQSRALIQEILSVLPYLQTGLQTKLDMLPPSNGAPSPQTRPRQMVVRAIIANPRKHIGVKPPFLALIADPQACSKDCDSAAAKSTAAAVTAQADSIAAAYPEARIVRLPRADHFVWRSHEADVVREMNAFMDRLGK
ncbi:MAG TPA: alpha/beta hydrolase [Rhizomicrobium sp.]|nr:alpha/beta hydrolase [Rhizomicrobium sp.]